MSCCSGFEAFESSKSAAARWRARIDIYRMPELDYGTWRAGELRTIPP